MDEKELLQAIGEMMDKKREPIQRDISGLKAGQKALRQDVSDLKDGQLKINIKLENDIGQKISALFDGHALDSEMIQSIKDSVEIIEETVAVNDSLSKINARDIRKLKEKLG